MNKPAILARRRRPAGAGGGAPRSCARIIERPTQSSARRRARRRCPRFASSRRAATRWPSWSAISACLACRARTAGAGTRDVSACAPRAAHGLLGHRRGDQGHQRRACRSLPFQAVGSARRDACSRSSTSLLDAWQAEYQPEAKGLRLVGHQWSPRSHEIKHFLAGNLIPYQMA